MIIAPVGERNTAIYNKLTEMKKNGVSKEKDL